MPAARSTYRNLSGVPVSRCLPRYAWPSFFVLLPSPRPKQQRLFANKIHIRRLHVPGVVTMNVFRNDSIKIAVMRFACKTYFTRSVFNRVQQQTTLTYTRASAHAHTFTSIRFKRTCKYFVFDVVAIYENYLNFFPSSLLRLIGSCAWRLRPAVDAPGVFARTQIAVAADRLRISDVAAVVTTVLGAGIPSVPNRYEPGTPNKHVRTDNLPAFFSFAFRTSAMRVHGDNGRDTRQRSFSDAIRTHGRPRLTDLGGRYRFEKWPTAWKRREKSIRFHVRVKCYHKTNIDTKTVIYLCFIILLLFIEKHQN